MKKSSFKEHFSLSRELIRPAFYQVFTRYLISLCLALLWDFFFNKNGLRSKSTAFLFFAIYFLIMAWLAYLRIDGVHVPKFDRKLYTWKRKPIRTYADLIDYTDEDIVKYDELDPEDQDQCLLIANAATTVLFFATTILFP